MQLLWPLKFVVSALAHVSSQCSFVVNVHFAFGPALYTGVIIILYGLLPISLLSVGK